jgi:hypothetical protein
VTAQPGGAQPERRDEFHGRRERVGDRLTVIDAHGGQQHAVELAEQQVAVRQPASVQCDKAFERGAIGRARGRTVMVADIRGCYWA